MDLIRFSIGSADEQLVGILSVVSFAKTQNTLVSIDVLRARMQMPMSGRTGGVGARLPSEVTILLPDVTHSEIPFPDSVRLPPTAVRAEQLIWGGTVDVSHTETRFATLATVAELMKIIEPQITNRGWTVDVRAGDSLLAVTKFSPSWGGDSTAVLLLTSFPGTGEVSVILNVFRNRI